MKKRHKIDKKTLYIVYFFAIIFISIIMIYYNTPVYSLAKEERIIRVGFFPVGRFHDYDLAGQPAGYDVDYLNQVSKYTGWSYQFIPVQDWETALILLQKGDIDLLGGMWLTEERMEQYRYCAYSNGAAYDVLITQKQKEELIYEDFEKFSELRIGTVENYKRKENFLSYAQQNNFTPTLIDYKDIKQAREAMNSGEIDAMIGSSMDIIPEEKILAKYNPAPIFYISNQQNKTMMEELDRAIVQIKINTPELENQLMRQYYPECMQEPLNKEELDFIEQCDTLTVGYYTNRKPLSYLDSSTNKAKGILKDFLILISEKSGLNFEFVPVDEKETLTGCFERKNLDLMIGITNNAINRVEPSSRLTESFWKSDITLYTMNDSEILKDTFKLLKEKTLKIAVTDGWRDGKRYVSAAYPGCEIISYQNTMECLEAVRKREVDVTLQNDYIIGYLLKKPIYDKITAISESNTYEELCIAINKTHSKHLDSILNKTIKTITDQEKKQIISSYISALIVPFSISDFLYQYRTSIIIAGTFLMLVIVILGYVFHLRRKNERIAIENERKLANITNNIDGGVITLVLDQSMTILYANNGFWQLLGYGAGQEENRFLTSFVHKDDVSQLEEVIKKRRQDHAAMEQELRLCHKEKGYLPVLFRGTFVLDEKEEPLLYCVVVDITAQKQMQELLEMEKERYRIILEQSNDIIFDADLQKKEFLCSRNFYDKFGWQCDRAYDVRKEKNKNLIHPEDIATIEQLIKRIEQGEETTDSFLIRIPTADGRYLWCRVEITGMCKENQLMRIVGKIVDVDNAVREKDELEWKSKRDHLTNLYNKTAFLEKLEQSIKNKQKGAILFLDLDHFKTLNDTLGHIVGDKAIIKTAETLKRIFKNTASIGRFGGDEFCIFIQSNSKEFLEQQAQCICKALLLDFEKDGKRVSISASLGVYQITDTDLSAQDVLQKADEALYQAKSAGKNGYAIYS